MSPVGDATILAPAAPTSFTHVVPGRKGQILDAAFAVFSERGYDAGSMREIALRVGVSEPALYRHYAGKEAILDALLRVAAALVRDEGTALIDAIEPHNARDRLALLFSDRRSRVRHYAPVFKLFLTSVDRESSLADDLRTQTLAPLIRTVTGKVAVLDAAFGVADAEATRPARVRALLSLVAGYVLTSITLGDSPDAVIADAVMHLMQWSGPPVSPTRSPAADRA